MLSEDRPAIDSPVSLTSEPDRFSDEAWELLLAGQDLARRWRHGELDVEHLMQVLFSDRRFAGSLRGLSLDADDLLDQLEGFLAEQPMARSEDLFIGEDLEQLLEAADRVRALWGSRLIELSHLLIAMGRDPRIGADCLASAGLPADRLESELRRQRPTAAAAPVPPPPVPPPPVPASLNR
jgi:ATPases with chaperone activity, ATP-binding subunit